MFAPQPIVMRYDNAGVLGQAAAAIGSNDAALRNRQFVSDDLASLNAMNQQLTNRTEQANQLQMAGQMASQRQGSTASSSLSGGYIGSSPFAQAVSTAKKQVLSDAEPNLSDSQKAVFQAQLLDPNTDVGKFQNAVQSAVTDKQNSEAKQQLVEAAKDKVHPDDADMISAAAGDSKFSTNDVRLAIQKSMQRRGNEDALKTQQAQKQQLWSQAGSVLSASDQAQIAPLVEDPKVTAVQLNAAVAQAHQRAAMAKHSDQVAQMQQQRFQTAKLFQQAHQMEKEHPEINFAGDPPADDKESLALYQQYHAIRDKADSMLSGTGDGQSQPVQVQSPDDAQKLPSGTQFVTPDGQIRVRH